MSSAKVFARAAVAGNPSDGYDGAVCSVIVPQFSAVASTTATADASIPLVSTAIERFGREVAPVSVGVTIETTIPRSVGLAGSSAIVVAVIQALASHTGTDLSPMEVARLAYDVERVDLGIAGGWQDQLIQSHGYSALIECAEPRDVHPIAMSTVRTLPLYLAWSHSAAQASGDAHAKLQSEHTSESPEMRELAELGRQAAKSFADGDVHSLKQAINSTFDIRRTVMDIAPAQVEMVETARSLGASANFAGSGGAILGVLPKDGDQFLGQLRDVGYEVTTWEAA